MKRAEHDRVCHSRSTHRRFQDWVGVFHEILRKGPLQYDQVVGIDWAWLNCDGAMGRRATENDHKLLKGTLDSNPIERPEPTEESPQGICLDGASDNGEVREPKGEAQKRLHRRLLPAQCHSDRVAAPSTWEAVASMLQPPTTPIGAKRWRPGSLRDGRRGRLCGDVLV